MGIEGAKKGTKECLGLVWEKDRLKGRMDLGVEGALN